MEESPSSSSPSSSSASTSQHLAEEANPDSENSNEQNHQQLPSLTYRVDISMANSYLAATRDDVWSCLIILVTFWLVATMGLVLGIYGTTTLQLGPYSSVLIQVNSMFVQSITVEHVDEPKPGIMLYGFDESPGLDVKMNWSKSYSGSLQHNFYKEWIFYLNKHSQLDIFYNVKSPRLSYLSLVIAQGREQLFEWIEKPSFPNTTLSWNIIYGRNNITQKISDPFSYYVVLANSQTEDVEVELKFSVDAVLYNTSNAINRCSPDSSLCRLDLFLSQSGSAVLTTPAPSQGNFEAELFHVKLSYAPRWITYFVASGILTLLIFFILRCCKVFQRDGSDMESFQQVRVVSERAPLLLGDKNDDVSSLGSSYESFTSEEEDLTELLKGKPLKEGEAEKSLKHLCVICFDAPRDCFFLPCGHCAACFECGTRVVDEASPCPICRRRIKKVRKVFTV
ncbi:E3 ubiquitin-protein ligase APD2-like isoform X2 [Prosopis cineraria]|uniref:E3 ubiquitin-protein ligase APD2-like isoform X2 n=1 Tax=Prosopis cineraria TaxID=364024 RepID=UPI00240F8239|nr:E3 ubiquitin-protein ligase APD2-like isoform X2 [Prosopis cineraria]